MNNRIVNIPPRTVRRASRTPLTFDTTSPALGEGEDPIRQLALDIVNLDPLLASLLARSGHNLLKQ